ncbi:TlpA disulfide reductase family protein [Hyphomicrobium sp.]|uniref:TlpA family protein disulfide reductase n=1 Tax=Hyphomicrobium sp. TaxID=82 RepID=UPI0025BAAFC8|nr:TlpA disulfide reductase family protein [Hyphomicrobium sp.]MCC7251490.1 TlpA family protein disulfide reductase [Hyphomicrobium sp.]
MNENGNAPGAPQRSTAVPIALAAVAALVGFAAVYGTLDRPDNTSLTGNAAPAPEKHAPDTRRRAPGLPAFVYKATPEPLADVNFVDGTGAPKTLKDFRGKTVLLNLWATWCAPCREEMPSLDRLQAELGSDTFEVVALAVDRTGLDAARRFLDGIEVKTLALYADPTTRSGSALKAIGMPTTILIDAEGREIGRLSGPAEWDSEAAKRLITDTLAPPAAASN